MTTGAPRIGVIGGSGLYALFPGVPARTIATPFGSAEVTVGELGGREVAFLTRHGADHSVPPHLIDYRSNVWALASVGVRAIVSSSAVGGLHPDYPPGTLVLTDQLVDRTWGRPDTFFTGAASGGGSVQHLALGEPFDPELHRIARDALEAAGERVTASGTVVVIQGPRFSTRAESSWYRAQGGHTVNMTMAPEVALAAELGLRTVNLSFVTDSDAGEADGSDADDVASGERVLERLAAAQPRIVAAIGTIVAALPDELPLGTGVPAAAIDEVLSRPVLLPASEPGAP